MIRVSSASRSIWRPEQPHAAIVVLPMGAPPTVPHVVIRANGLIVALIGPRRTVDEDQTISSIGCSTRFAAVASYRRRWSVSRIESRRPKRQSG